MTFQTEKEPAPETPAPEQQPEQKFTFNARTELLVDILKVCRPHRSKAEKRFIRDFLAPLGPMKDAVGNRYLRIGDAPVMWSCHTDTVARMGGMQNIYYDDKGVLGTNSGDKRPDGEQLGADDGAGVWLMLQMIEAKVPGLYIFHRGEEVGCIGSGWLVKHNPTLVAGIKFAIALDRRGKKDVITHQRGSRCCSDDFAKSLAEQLGGGYSPCHGVYTDTAMYTGLIGECTNISVGYEGAHGSCETLDVPFIDGLREKLINLDVSKLVEKRKPGETETRTYTSYGYGGGSAYGSYSGYDGYCDYDGYYYRSRQDKIRENVNGSLDDPSWLPERGKSPWKANDYKVGRTVWMGITFGYVTKLEQAVIEWRRLKQKEEQEENTKQHNLTKSSNGNLYNSPANASSSNSNGKTWSKHYGVKKKPNGVTVVTSLPPTGNSIAQLCQTAKYVMGLTDKNPWASSSGKEPSGPSLFDENTFGPTKEKTIEDWCRDYPGVVADYLLHMGATAQDIKEWIAAAFRGII